MEYFFVLGNHPDLSRAELAARLPMRRNLRIGPEILLAEVNEAVDESELIRTVGGTIKVGSIRATVPAQQAAVLAASAHILQEIPKSGKFNFGISLYGAARLNIGPIGLELKKVLKQENVSCRFVTSRDKTLSSVVVEQNKLTRGGCELVYIADGNKVHIGVTAAVQPFKDLSARDYGRPARDDRSGMLPPKLAQAMINLSGAGTEDIILDPFCGSGTILTEAMLMGFKKIAGSDISAKAISDSKKNIDWVLERYPDAAVPEISQLDARRLTERFKKESVGAIVAETYLGPQRGFVDIKKVSAELGQLYQVFLRAAATILKKKGTLVIALPAFVREGKPHSLSLNLQPFTLRQKFLYGRAGQKVWRDILVLEK